MPIGVPASQPSVAQGSGSRSLSPPKRTPRPAARRMPTTRTSFGSAEDVKDLAQLRAHRDVEPFAGRQAALEPADVDAFELAGFGKTPEGRVDDLRELRIVLPIHDPIRIVGQEIADDDERF